MTIKKPVDKYSKHVRLWTYICIISFILFVMYYDIPEDPVLDFLIPILFAIIILLPIIALNKLRAGDRKIEASIKRVSKDNEKVLFSTMDQKSNIGFTRLLLESIALVGILVIIVISFLRGNLEILVYALLSLILGLIIIRNKHHQIENVMGLIELKESSLVVGDLRENKIEIPYDNITEVKTKGKIVHIKSSVGSLTYLQPTDFDRFMKVLSKKVSLKVNEKQRKKWKRETIRVMLLVSIALLFLISHIYETIGESLLLNLVTNIILLIGPVLVYPIVHLIFFKLEENTLLLSRIGYLLVSWSIFNFVTALSEASPIGFWTIMSVGVIQIISGIALIVHTRTKKT